MAVWISISAIVSALAPLRLRIAAFAILCPGVSVCVLIFKIVTGSKILTALAWALSFLGAMQLAYLAGALVFSSATMKLNELYLRVGELIYNRT